MYGNYHIVENIIIICKKSTRVFSVIMWAWKGRLCSQFNRLFHLGVKEVGDIVEAPSQTILDFVEAQQLLRIPPDYGFI